MKKTALTLLMSSVLAVPAVFAQSASDDAIQYRQGVYKAMEWNLTRMAAMVQGRAEYSAEEFSRRSERLVLLSGMVSEGFADEQSARGEAVETRASYRIWQQQDRFGELMSEMQTRTQALQQAASSGEAADDLRPLVGRLAQSCKACHDKYRD
ncbi:c-type cytochrome [Marinobacterium stanieri]|uniref:c-type cytochrome n=1 Tax=Marinobacterium stanieri TaxID=49186 RepID=UPI000255A91E|nr:cytochrome c [Marinobacterium stanieri]